MASDNNSSKSVSFGEELKSKSKPTGDVFDYLQAPRKKRRSFVILAAGPTFDSETILSIQKFMRTYFPKLAFVAVRSIDELLKYSMRNIVLAIVDDQLASRVETLRSIRRLKEQKHDAPLPTLFLTNDSAGLIADYQKELPVWHEVDEYVVMPEAQRHTLFAKIKSGLESKYQRRARRYKTSIPVTFQVLDSGEHRFKGVIHDFSLYGALIGSVEDGHRFSAKDQIVVHFPLSQMIKGKADVFRVSARVRRVLITGHKAGISWEHLSEEKLAIMTEMLTTLVDVTLAKAAGASRARLLSDPSARAEESTKIKGS